MNWQILLEVNRAKYNSDKRSVFGVSVVGIRYFVLKIIYLIHRLNSLTKEV